MLVTLLGIVSDERPAQYSNALSSILVTLLGIVNDEKTQPEKEYSLMLVTPLGIAIEARA